MSFILFSTLFALSKAQQSECLYRFENSPIELNLYSLKGSRFGFKDSDNTEWEYSVCADALPCSHDGMNMQAMVDHSPSGIQECFPWATLNVTIQPFYDFSIATWIFNYSNGEPCPDGSQINRTTTILWTCNPDVATPYFVDAFNYDTCNVMIEMQWAGACPVSPPPLEHCEFRSGLKSLNLSTVQGKTFSLKQMNENGNLNTVEFSPCSNSIQCDSTHSGEPFDVMADIKDSGGQCAKFFGIWAGDSIPFYDTTIFGQDYWDFFWMDGEECEEGGPLEILNVRYYCNPAVPTLNITKAYENGPCAFRLDIDSSLACDDA